jgi:hypothetical protein
LPNPRQIERNLHAQPVIGRPAQRLAQTVKIILWGRVRDDGNYKKVS